MRRFPARELLERLTALVEMDPEARLSRNPVGNLAIYDHGGCFVGWLDLADPASSRLPDYGDEGTSGPVHPLEGAVRVMVRRTNTLTIMKGAAARAATNGMSNQCGTHQHDACGSGALHCLCFCHDPEDEDEGCCPDLSPQRGHPCRVINAAGSVGTHRCYPGGGAAP